MAELCDAFGFPKKGPEAKALAAEVIRRAGDFGAIQSSETFKRFGKVCHRYIWPPLEVQENLWTVPPLEPIPGRSLALLDWLKAHPDDPRSAIVLEVMGEAGAAV